MYGKIRSKYNKREKFVADSGTGIPIIPIEIVEDHGLKWEKVDGDEPGCESASGHDMKVIGQCSFWVKFDTMLHRKLIKGLVAEQAGQEILIDLEDQEVQWAQELSALHSTWFSNTLRIKRTVLHQKMRQSSFRFGSRSYKTKR